MASLRGTAEIHWEQHHFCYPEMATRTVKRNPVVQDMRFGVFFQLPPGTEGASDNCVSL